MAEQPATQRPSNQTDFVLRLADLPADELKVLAVEGREALSELYHFRVELAVAGDELDPAALIEQPALLEIAGDSGTRYVHGMIRRFQRTGEGVRQIYYVVEIVPVHWLLTRRRGSRIFQQHNCSDMSVPGIITQVFTDAGIAADAYRLALEGDYEVREYVVQYCETEMDFITRLMEEEGIFYFFEHGADGHRMVIGDSPVAHVAAPFDEQLRYRAPRGLVPDEDCVYQLRDTHEVGYGAVRLDDYDFTRPGTELRVTASGGRNSALEFSHYPGNYREKQVGGRYAQVRLEELQCTQRVAELRATARGLVPGFKFTLSEHPAQTLNLEYLVTEVRHIARQPQGAEAEGGDEADTPLYQAEVRTIPADVPFRPPRVTPHPRIAGAQTALVVGPQGEEIHTDKYGRVKVQFHWDAEGTHDDNSSRWIRVSHGSAGGQYGALFLPRVGQEVVVEFLEGDPDHPVVTGRVYNNDHMPPYTLPDDRTRSGIKTHSSTGGGGTNEIRIEDKKDQEQILIHAQKDFHLRVTNDRVENVEHDRHLTVDNDKRELVKNNSDLEIKNNFAAKVGADHALDIVGKKSEHVAGTLSITCDSDVVEKYSANHKHEVTTTYAAKAQSIKLEASSALELKVGGNHIIISSAGIELKQGGASIGLAGGTVFIKGAPTVMINTAPAPPGTPVGPVTASATSPAAPQAPLEADDSEPGRDTTYQAQPFEAEQLEPPTATFEPGEPEEPVEQELTWIEIELVDESDQPVPGERFELLLPDGKIRKGSLDANGRARVENVPPGACQVCFPGLDAEAWEEIA